MLFWGALWGFAEATVGFILHRAAIALPGLPGFLMFPIAFFFMQRAVLSSKSPDSAFLASLVAASIKLADFLLPGYDALRIVNPALSMLAEGLAVYVVMGYCDSRKVSIGALAAFGMGLLWRGAFSLYLLAISLYGLPAALVTGGWAYALRFLLLESAVNALIILAYLRSSEKAPVFLKADPSAWSAIAALLLAIAANLAI